MPRIAAAAPASRTGKKQSMRWPSAARVEQVGGDAGTPAAFLGGSESDPCDVKGPRPQRRPIVTVVRQ